MASKRDALIASAEKALQKGKPDAALKDYLKALEEAPNDINVLGKVGDLLVRLNRNDDSIPYFTRIAEHYGKDGFYVKAIAMYKKINRLDPSRLEIYEKLAELYTKQGLGMEAKSNYQVLADYLLKQDNVSGAIGIYQKMVAIEPGNLQLHVKLADLFTQAKRIPEALKEYAIVASSLGERGAHEEAIRVYEKALKLAPDNLDILKTLVPLLISINALEQARLVLRKALETTPRSVPLFLLSAEVALAAADMAEARSFATKAQAVEPENEEVLSTAVRIQLKGRRPDLAFAAAAPLADIAVRRGEAKKAIALLVPIAKAAPDQEDIIRKVIEVASGSGDETTALPYRSALAELLRKQGKVADAADVLRTCARVAPDNAEFRARLAQLEPLLGGAAAGARPPDVRPEEVTLSGLDVRWPGAAPPPGPTPPAARPAPPPTVPSPPKPAAPARKADEFEFDLADEDLVEEAPPSIVMPSPVPPPPAAPPVSPWDSVTPPRGVAAAQPITPEEVAEIGMDWAPGSAAEALAAYEARTAEPVPPALEEVVEELEPPHELRRPPAAMLVPPSEPAWSGAPPLSFHGSSLEAPEASSWAVPAPPAAQAPAQPSPAALDWDLGALPPIATVGGPPTVPPKAASVDSEIDEALVEAEVFRKYGLLEKAVDQLSPFLAKAPESVKLREKLFELYLEMGRHDLASREAEVLRERYRLEGREERTKGLDALLGLSQPISALAPVAPAPEPPPEEEIPPAPPSMMLELERFEPGPTTPLDWSPPPVVAPSALPTGLVAELPEPETDLSLPPLPAPLLEPVVEPVVHAAPSVPPAPAETSIETPVPRPHSVDLDLAGLVPETLPSATPPPTPVRPLESLVAELAHPAAPAKPAEERKPPRPLPSADELLRAGAPAAPPKKKVAKVSPGDIQLDIIARPAEPRPPKHKPAPAVPELPADLLARPVAKEARPKAPTASLPLPGDLLQSLGVSPRPKARPAPEAPPRALPEAAPAAEAPAAAPEGPRAETVSVPALAPVPSGPAAEDLSEVDFCLDQGMVVDAAERLQSLETRFPGHPDVAARRQRLEGARGASGEAPRPALHDILSEDLDSVLDAELGRALSDEMVRGSAEAGLPGAGPRPPAAAGPPVDESGLFSDEQEFFNFADELRTELKKEAAPPSPGEGPGQEVSLEEIFRDFKKGVEQQLSPEDYETHYNLGIAYKEMGLTDEAIGEFQLAAKDPLHAVECCSMLGLCFLEKGLPQLAVKWYRKGLETIGIREDDKLGLLYDLGNVLEQIGDREGAYKAYVEIFGISASFRDVNDRIKALKPATA